MTFVVVFLRGLVAQVPAQTEISEPDLVAVSGGRTLRIGSTVDGHVTLIPLEVVRLARPRRGRRADARLTRRNRRSRSRSAPTRSRTSIATRATATTSATARTARCRVRRHPSSRRAAMATIGQVLTYRGDIAEVFYSASCGGRSERAGGRLARRGLSVPRLPPGRRVRGRSGVDGRIHAAWTCRRPLERVGFEGERLENIRVDARTSSGRVARLRLSGLRPDVIGGEQFRLAIGAVESAKHCVQR